MWTFTLSNVEADRWRDCHKSLENIPNPLAWVPAVEEFLEFVRDKCNSPPETKESGLWFTQRAVQLEEITAALARFDLAKEKLK